MRNLAIQNDYLPSVQQVVPAASTALRQVWQNCDLCGGGRGEVQSHPSCQAATTSCRNQRLQHSSAGINATKDFFPITRGWSGSVLTSVRTESLWGMRQPAVWPSLCLWNPAEVKVNSVHLITVKLDWVASTALKECSLYKWELGLI